MSTMKASALYHLLLVRARTYVPNLDARSVAVLDEIRESLSVRTENREFVVTWTMAGAAREVSVAMGVFTFYAVGDSPAAPPAGERDREHGNREEADRLWRRMLKEAGVQFVPAGPVKPMRSGAQRRSPAVAAFVVLTAAGGYGLSGSPAEAALAALMALLAMSWLVSLSRSQLQQSAGLVEFAIAALGAMLPAALGAALQSDTALPALLGGLLLCAWGEAASNGGWVPWAAGGALVGVSAALPNGLSGMPVFVAVVLLAVLAMIVRRPVYRRGSGAFAVGAAIALVMAWTAGELPPGLLPPDSSRPLSSGLSIALLLAACLWWIHGVMRNAMPWVAMVIVGVHGAAVALTAQGSTAIVACSGVVLVLCIRVLAAIACRLEVVQGLLKRRRMAILLRR